MDGFITFLLLGYVVIYIFYDSREKTVGYKNIHKLKKMIEEIIYNYERSFHDNTPSCKHEMMDIIHPVLDNSIEAAHSWKKTYNLRDRNSCIFYDSLAYIAIYTAAFNIVSNSKNHIVRGTIDYSGIANYAEKILYNCLDYLVSNNIITEEEQNREISQLKICIETYCGGYLKTYKDFYLYSEAIYKHFPRKKTFKEQFDDLLIKHFR